MKNYKEKYKETGIPCFECGERSGVDCAGREPNEATRCEICLKSFLKDLHKQQRERMKSYHHMKTTKNRIVFGKFHDSSDPTSDIDQLIFTKTKTGISIKEKLAYDRYASSYDGKIPLEVFQMVAAEFKK